MIANRVVWYEGMFLQPQHFQQQDRFIENMIVQKQRHISRYAWGFSELELDMDLLNVGKIGVKCAKAIFPDGTLLDIPAIDKPPEPYTIPEGLTDATLFLAIRLRQEGVADMGTEQSEQVRRHNVWTVEIADAIADKHEKNEIQIGSLHSVILSEHDNLSAYTVLPITIVAESRANYQITLDKTFLSTWLNAQQSLLLRNFTQEIKTLLYHRAQMLAARLTNTAQAGTAEVIDFMLLQLANKYEALFNHLTEQPLLHPEQLYLSLIQLLAEITTYTNDDRRPGKIAAYNHLCLGETFQPLMQTLRSALGVVLEQNAVSIALTAKSHGLWLGQINEKYLLDNAQFVLAIYADLPGETIREELINKIKIAPVEHIQTLIARALPGIELSSIAVAPRQIPYHANFNYFVLNKHHPLWQKLTDSAGIALHVGANVPHLKLELWAIKG